MKILKDKWSLFISSMILLLVAVLVVGVVKDKKVNDINRIAAEKINTEDALIKNSLPSITCWGDSLTAGTGGNGTTYPRELEKSIKLKVYNMGVGGEKTNTIACRQGTRHIIVNDIVIPSTTEKVQVGSYNNLYDNYGQIVQPLRQGESSIKCSIAGISGILISTQTDSTSDDLVYYFQRSQSGSEVEINQPTPIYFEGIDKRKDDITIIFIGQNGGYSDIDDLVNQQKSMIEYTGHDKYIILGLTTGTSEERKKLEDRMSQEYGDKYINLREYLSTNGMNDAGLTPTDTDAEQMSQGKVPDSLRSDNVHGNSYFYKLIGKQVYKKIIELNYLSDDQKQYLMLK